MKKIFLIIACLIVVFALLYFIPVTQKKTIPVATDIFNITSEIIQPQNWKKWQQTIHAVYTKDSSLVQVNKSAGNKDFSIFLPEHTFHVQQVSPVLYLIQETIDNATFPYAITIIPNEGKEVNLLVVKKTNLLRVLFPFKKSPADNTVNSLKYFLENPDTFYGYSITIKKIVDTAVATKKITINKKELFQVLPQTFKELTQYVQQHQLHPVKNWEVSYDDLYNDSLVVMAGIPVNTFSSPFADIKCLNLPKGRMLAAYYEGRFKDRKSIYNAMERYIADHNYRKVAVPFERYVNNLLPASDTSLVRFELYYPIY